MTRAGRTDTASAVVAAPRKRVWESLVDPSARERWLPPTGMTGRLDRFDVRPGGGYRMVLTYDDPATPGKSGGGTDVVEVRFVAVEAPHRLVEEADFVSDDPRFAGTMTMTWSLEPTGDDLTTLTITASDVPEGISRDDHLAAFASTLAQLSRHVTTGEARA